MAFYRCMTVASEEGLPSAYQQVAWLMGNQVDVAGMNYIDTGIYAENNSEITTSIEVQAWIKFNRYDRIFGGTKDLLSLEVENTNYLRFRYRNGGFVAQTPVAMSDYTELKILAQKNNLYINGKYAGYSLHTDFTDSNTIRLFSEADGNRDSKMKLEYCKIWKNDELLRDFIPCYRKADSEPGLYDFVSGTFFPNDGTGSFSVGADVN